MDDILINGFDHLTDFSFADGPEAKLIKKKDLIVDNYLEYLDSFWNLDTTEEMAIPDLAILKGTCATIVGHGGDGKTWLQLWCAAKCAAGESILPWGTAPTRPLKSLILDYETGKKQTLKRLRRILYGSSLDISKNIAYRHMTSKLDGVELERLKTVIKLAEIDIVWIDNLRAASNSDMNDQHAADILTELRSIAAETNCAIIMLHHKSKQVSGAKTAGTGTQAFTDAVQLKLVLEKQADSPLIQISTGKANDYRCETFFYELVDFGEPVKKWAGKSAGLKLGFTTTDRAKEEAATKKREDWELTYRPKILEIAKSGMSKSKIANEVGGNRTKILALIDKMIEEKEISLC